MLGKRNKYDYLDLSRQSVWPYDRIESTYDLSRKMGTFKHHNHDNT